MIHVTIQQLSSYLDEQLHEGSADLVRQHLAECPDCESKLGTLSRMDAALTRALSHDPGEDLFRRLEREIATTLEPNAAAKAREILEAPAQASASAPASARTTAPSSARTTAPSSARATAPASARTTAPASARTAAPASARTTAPASARTTAPASARTTAAAPVPKHATPARTQEDPRGKNSSAGTWIAVLSLAVIAGSVGVVVSHTGAVQGWLDSLISKPNFTVAKPGASSGPEPVTPDLAATDTSSAMADVLTMIEPSPLEAGESPDGSAAAPIPPPPPPPPPSRSSRSTTTDLDPVDDFEDSGGGEFTEVPQTMSADEALATPPPNSAGSARGPGGTRRTDPYASLRPHSRAAVREAERVHEATLFHPTAEQFEVVARRWERALEGVSGPEQAMIRGRLADARYRAWEAGPTPERADAAMSAIRSYLLFAPPGTAREEARARLARLDPR